MEQVHKLEFMHETITAYLKMEYVDIWTYIHTQNIKKQENTQSREHKRVIIF